MDNSLHKQSLAEQLEQRKALGASKTPPEVTRLRETETQKLIESGIAEQSLKQGDIAPDFTLPNADGQPVHLSDLLKNGPIIVTFYRGSWCPYCNLQLRAYQIILPELTRLGATLVAISPQTPDASKEIITKGELAFPVLSDIGNYVARTYGLVFTLPETLRPYTANLPQYNADDSWELPLAGTFVVARDGIIQLAFVDADYTKRLDPSKIINAVTQLM